ncbi:MAG: FKBP-type peptidyl-prolyl cis-trans isomerase [Pseudomonadales bacterium]
MQKALKNSLLLALSLVFSSLSSAEESQPPAPEPVTDSEIAYFFGYRFGNALLEGGNGDVDMEDLMKGMQDSLDRAEPKLDQPRQQLVIQEIQRRRIAQLEQLATDFMTENRKQEGVQETASGLQYVVLEPGGGDAPDIDSQVTVHYEGRLINNQVFDSSLQRGQPATFALNQVIAGWTEGLQLMKEGGKTRFFIPPELGYGPGGTSSIPPHAVLVFDVQLIEVVEEEAAATTP